MKPQIVFFGTGPVSLATLKGIVDSFNIEAIITKPDAIAPSGRPHDAPVKQWAKEHNITLFQPADKAELVDLTQAQNFMSKAGLVVDYGLIIPQAVITSFPLGIINSHFSLLPQLRGADPITFAILEGKAETGVSLMTIVEALDEGPLIAQETLAVPQNCSAPQLTDQLVKLSNKLIQSVVPEYVNGSIKPYYQDNSVTPTYTRKLVKADGRIDWTKPAAEIERQVRAFLGWPGTSTRLFDRDLIITRASTIPSQGQPGQPFRHEKGFAINAGKDALMVQELKPAGKSEMTAQAFIAGLPANAWPAKFH